jgi:NADH:ubiquinone oxidoreductase subunit D
VAVGVLSANAATLFGATGPILRGSGVLYDLRFSSIEAYAAYSAINARSYVGVAGDSYDRFLVRSRELFESMNIIYQVIANIGGADVAISRSVDILGGSGVFKTKMESLINKFKSAVEPSVATDKITYRAVEAGKGEFGVMLVTNSTYRPYRVYLRSPAFNHLQLIGLLGAGHMFADIVTVVGTLDLVFGEVDR